MKGKSWLQEHLKDFVEPRLGTIPVESKANFFSKEEMAVIKNIWRSAKKASAGKLLVLPGRDMFVFEILARRESFSTLFLPGCSRVTADFFKDKIPPNSFMLDLGLTDFTSAENYKIFQDTSTIHKVLKRMHGIAHELDCNCRETIVKEFAQTLPVMLDMNDFKYICCDLGAGGAMDKVFPNLALGRSLALKIRSAPKYWKEPEITEGKVHQNCSRLLEFRRAAVLTMQIYKDSSPAFINKRSPLVVNLT